MTPLRLLLTAAAVAAATGFVAPLTRRPLAPAARHMSSTPDAAASVPIVVSGRNVAVTDALMEHVQKRIGGVVNKLAGNGLIRDCDVVLSVSKNPKDDSHRVEVVTSLKGTSVIVKSESPDMYNSIDAVSHALNRKLRKYKERRTEGWHGGASMSADLLQAFDELEQMEVPEADPAAADMAFEDPEKKEVVKVNSFDLQHPISVEEAVFALDYVDHDFYVFKNKATDKITVVYKRHVGGVGLIEP